MGEVEREIALVTGASLAAHRQNHLNQGRLYRTAPSFTQINQAVLGFGELIDSPQNDGRAPLADLSTSGLGTRQGWQHWPFGALALAACCADP